jgi:cytosine deaminase
MATATCSSAMIVGYRSGFNTDAQLATALDMVTTHAARALGLADYGLVEGGAADFVVLDAEHVQEAVVARPKPRDVYKKGRLVASNGSIMPAARNPSDMGRTMPS